MLTPAEYDQAWKTTARAKRGRFRCEVNLDWWPIRVWCEL